MLLTSGQVSMTISSCIVFLFTSLLFLSGYVLQQQTVRSIQQVINKPSPGHGSQSTAAASPSSTAVARTFGQTPGSRGHASFQEYLSRPSEGWSKVAYAQLVTDHAQVCTAVMLFADLYRMKSPAQRVLLFPKTWATTGKGEYSDPYLDTSKRLLKMAARRYDVTLQPVDPIVEGADDSKPSSYPLALLFSLKQYKRLLYLQPSGFLLDSSPLDSLLTIPFESSLAALPADSTPAQSASALFIQPSAPHSSQFQDSSLTGAFSVADLLRILPAESLPVSAEEVDSLVRETSSLSQEAGDFNVTAFFSTAAYLQFSDPHLPGPEYDIPRMDFLRAKPSNVGARVAWESMYEKFRERRMDSCGLDLEPYRPPAIEEIKDSETPNEALENDTQTEL